MKQLLQKLIKALAYIAAGIVIILAIAVGIFRLMLPRLPEYQEDIKRWASTAIGMRVEFAGMNARWRLSGPELSFFRAGLGRPGSDEDILEAGEVSIGVGLLRLIADRELVVDRVSIRNTNIDLRQDEAGDWLLQGVSLDELIGMRRASPGGEIEIVGQNIEVSYEHPESGQVVPVLLRSISFTSGQEELRVEADVDLPREFGDRVEVSANKLNLDGVEDTWRIYVEGESLDMTGWSRLLPVTYPSVVSGMADLDVWLDLSAGTVTSATANVVLSGLRTGGPDTLPPVDLQSSFEYSTEPDGWLLAANQLRVSTVESDWPQSSLQLRVIKEPDQPVSGLRASALYFNLDDLRYVAPWLPADRRATLAAYAPSGILRGVSVDLQGFDTEHLDFDVSADLESVGIAAVDGRPGVRFLSGRIRADSDGGRVEIASHDLSIDLGEQLEQALEFDDASGTVIWRRNAAGIIVLSDSVMIRNVDLDSQMSLQVSIPSSGESPVVDFNSTWSVHDLSAMSRYLPTKLIQPNLREWLTNAMVAGFVPRGTTQFTGPLDRFPFDDGSGEFRIEARLEDATLRYSPKWPAPQFNHLDLVVENMHLYSLENSTINLGNSVEDAKIDIPDLRNPVLHIDAFATGTLDSIKTYASQSPINEVLGGQLDRVDVDGDASFDLSIIYPIQDKENYDFSTRIRSSNGTVRVVGFPAPITELNGVVHITRDAVTSEELFGQFLGYPVDLQLSRIADPASPYSIVLQATGRTTADALQAELNMPIGDIIEGDTDYEATLRFPNSQAPQPGLLQILVKSDLYGMQSNLPAPLGKSDDEALAMTLNIEFPAENLISAVGSLAGEINWTAQFRRENENWDFDRGVLAVGGDYPRDPETRGLHVQGQAAHVDLEAWLAQGRRGNREFGIGDRIRSIDLRIGQFHAVGQKFTDHRLVVDRSGRDWVIEISGDEAEGVVTVPYDFQADRPMTLDMERLILPGDDDTEDAEGAEVDPRSLPAISIRANEFALGQRHFGTLAVDFERTDRGLEATNFVTTDDSFTVEGSAGWIFDPYGESNQSTYFVSTLNSTDVRATSQRLAYDPGITSGSMEVNLDIGWPGGPRDDFMAVLNGSVSVRLGSGRLIEVEPGAGRVFGLMSFIALPRRLALDFSDVFDTGFSFDEITGNFRITNGDAYTCDLTLTGPAADVGIVGRAGLNTRDYSQSVIVSANVGNTLPVVGLFTGGPQVGAALLLFSQIFKKPLKDMGQVYYAVDGTWDEPVIGDSSSQHFAETSSMAGCISTTE